ncbi:MAG: hypothetical protein D6757_00395 [Alphaproteobacteria bacterium]|nr:MAG: hypothetical protein D6757_00395 [Alphaproteobacteria bacterium]
MTMPMDRTDPVVHVVGAGLAGLSAATALVDRSIPVRIYEAAPRAGGRCRSWHDEQLGCVIDNGNHLMLSGNHAVMAWLTTLGAGERLTGPARAVFPFLDLESGRRWTLDLGAGRWPGWLFDRARRIPDLGAFSHLRLVRRLMRAAPETPVAALAGADSPEMRFFLEPFTVAVLNRAPEDAAVGLLQPVLRETVLKGGAACRPRIARHSLEDTLVVPALERLKRAQTPIHFARRIRRIVREGGRVRALDTAGERITLGERDHLLLAVPQHAARRLLPALPAPADGEAIVNLHFRLAHPPFGAGVHLYGLIGGLAQWVFARDALVSVTISAADDLLDRGADELARQVYSEISRLWRHDATPAANKLPPYRVIKEKRATFAADADALGNRPGPHPLPLEAANLWLAGDWTATGLPATIESAVRSGLTAARHIAADLR